MAQPHITLPLATPKGPNLGVSPMYQRILSAPPRLAREGWIPAGPEKRTNKCAMLIPKTGDPTEHIPRLFDFSEVICPPERSRAQRRSC